MGQHVRQGRAHREIIRSARRNCPRVLHNRKARGLFLLLRKKCRQDRCLLPTVTTSQRCNGLPRFSRHTDRIQPCQTCAHVLTRQRDDAFDRCLPQPLHDCGNRTARRPCQRKEGCQQKRREHADDPQRKRLFQIQAEGAVIDRNVQRDTDHHRPAQPFMRRLVQPGIEMKEHQNTGHGRQ